MGLQKRSVVVFAFVCIVFPGMALAEEPVDSLSFQKVLPLDEVVVTGTRNEADVRHLPMTVSVVGQNQLARRYQPWGDGLWRVDRSRRRTQLAGNVGKRADAGAD